MPLQKLSATKTFLIIAGLFVNTACYGWLLTKDSLSAQKHKVKVAPLVELDHRFSLVNERFSHIWGLRLGVIINNHFKTGVGAYYLRTRLNGVYTIASGTIIQAYAIRQLYFGTLFYDPTIFENASFELALPLEGGFGKSNFTVYETLNKSPVNVTYKQFIPVGAGLSLTYKLPALFGIKQFRWIGIKGLVGYRYCLFKDLTPDFKVDYDGGFYSLAATLFLQQILRDVRGRSE